jgi:acetolactate synthase-1/2/3 large subunit
VIWANRSYAILRNELANVGAENPGPKALDVLSLSNPVIEWTKLANGLGVEACRVETVEDFAKALQGGLAARGPFLIEAVL